MMATIKKSLDEQSISQKRLLELKNRKDKDIDFSDIPELDETFWENAVLVHHEKKERPA